MSRANSSPTCEITHWMRAHRIAFGWDYSDRGRCYDVSEDEIDRALAAVPYDVAAVTVRRGGNWPPQLLLSKLVPAEGARVKRVWQVAS